MLVRTSMNYVVSGLLQGGVNQSQIVSLEDCLVFAHFNTLQAHQLLLFPDRYKP